jgi:hypothetical protein
MARAPRRVRGYGRALMVCLVVGGCAAAPTAPSRDPSFDWRNLLPAPLGSALQDLHANVHEVLVFRDVRDSADTHHQDCYRISGQTRRFLGRDADDYLFCYFHDRLDRVELTVTLPVEAPLKSFARYCDYWQNATIGRSRSAVSCQARDGDESFSAELGAVTDGAGAQLTIIVYDATLSEPPERQRQ